MRFLPPESQGGWRKLESLTISAAVAGMDPDKAGRIRGMAATGRSQVSRPS